MMILRKCSLYFCACMLSIVLYWGYFLALKLLLEWFQNKTTNLQISILEKTLKIFPYSYTFIDILFFVGHWHLLRMFSYWNDKLDSSHLSLLITSIYGLGLVFGITVWTTFHQIACTVESIIKRTSINSSTFISFFLQFKCVAL